MYDIYRVISELQFQVFNYFLVEKNQGQYLGRYVNLCYYVKDRTQVYTNLQKWEAFSEEKIQNMLESFPIYVSYTWKNGKLLADYCSETVAGYWLSSYLVLNQIFFGNKSIYTGLDTASPMDDKEGTKVYDSLDPEILTTAMIGLIIMVAAFVFCSFQVGRNQKNETLWLYGFDFLHTEVAMAVWVLLDIFFIIYFGYIINMSDMSEFFMVFLGFYFCVSVGLFMLFYLRFMRKIKLHNLWGKNILCAAIHPRGRFGETKTFPKLIIAIFGLMLLHFICFLITEFFGIMLCLVVDILVLLYIFREVGEKRRVIEGLCQMGSGNIDYKVDTTKLKGNNKELAEMVNSMGDSLKRAMAVRIQNERLQADLIVSISHDIKTPLTSIINYVDLLKRENIEDSKSEQLQKNESEISKLRDAVSKANSEAAKYRRQLTAKQSDAKAAEISQKEEYEKLVQENTELKKSISISERKAELIGIGYDEKLANETATAMVDGNLDVVIANQKKYLEEQKKVIKAEHMKNTPRPKEGSVQAGSTDYAKMIADAQASGNISAMAYYTRLASQGEINIDNNI